MQDIRASKRAVRGGLWIAGGRRGAAVVEMAFCLPIFMVIVFGIIEFGRATMVSETLTNAARLGARRAILDSANNEAVETVVKNFCNTTLAVPVGDVSVTITVTPGTGSSTSGNEVSSSTMGDLCTVLVQVPYSKVSWLPAKYLSGTNLSGRCAMERE